MKSCKELLRLDGKHDCVMRSTNKSVEITLLLDAIKFVSDPIALFSQQCQDDIARSMDETSSRQTNG